MARKRPKARAWAKQAAQSLAGLLAAENAEDAYELLHQSVGAVCEVFRKVTGASAGEVAEILEEAAALWTALEREECGHSALTGPTPEQKDYLQAQLEAMAERHRDERRQMLDRLGMGPN